MGYDRIASVDNAGIVSSLIEHAHIQTKHIGNIDGTAHTTLIRADYHHVFRVDLQIPDMIQKSFDKLVSRLYGLKAAKGNGVLYTGIMGIEGDDIVDSHADQFLQGNCTIQGLSGRALMLSAFI